jgi:hypothetical protein
MAMIILVPLPPSSSSSLWYRSWLLNVGVAAYSKWGVGILKSSYYEQFWQVSKI